MDIDKLTGDILKNSYLELPDPDFNAATMKKIVQFSRRRRVLNGILPYSFIFVSVDALIFLLLKLTGLNILDAADSVNYILTELLHHAGRLGGSVIGIGFIMYLASSLSGLILILTIIESKLNLWKRGRQRA
ncbi:MAG: hypothetical protein ACLP05_11410 [Candidatus Kryptoniota bacterium]